MNDAEAGRPSGRRVEARSTPYELVFTGGDFESTIFPGIRDEAAAMGVDPTEPERFAFLTRAADTIRQVTPDDAPPEALEQYRALLFHAYHFWRAGRMLYTFEPSAARFLVEAPPRLEGWSFTSPAPAVYVQLPANLFWSSIAPEVPPEPVDGFFLKIGVDQDAEGRSAARLEVLLVLGIRRARAGFSVIPLSAELTGGAPAAWGAGDRAGGDFSNTLPGGEIEGLYSMLTTDEVLKLVARCAWYIDHFPESIEEVPAAAADREGDEAPGTSLRYFRVGLADREGQRESE